MYNKIFTKLLTSSIWMESVPTRIVWLTCIAAMDEDGFVSSATPQNLANLANVGLPEATEAIRVLEAPDPNSSDPENDGRRIERVPGGWMVLNSRKYRDIVTRQVAKEQNRLRVARHRESKRMVMDVKRTCNGGVMQSEADSETISPKQVGSGDEELELEGGSLHSKPERKKTPLSSFEARLPDCWVTKRLSEMFHRRLKTPWTPSEMRAFQRLGTIEDEDLSALEAYYGANWPPQSSVNILRHDLLTLLNNFPGEVGRANNWLQTSKQPQTVTMSLR